MFRFAMPDGSGFDLSYLGSGPIAAFDADGRVVAICIGAEKRILRFLREAEKAQNKGEDTEHFKSEADGWLKLVESKDKPWSVNDLLSEDDNDDDEIPETLDELSESIGDHWGNPSNWDSWHVVKKMGEGPELTFQYMLAATWNVLESTQQFIYHLDCPIAGQ